jgi:hypothetical protein
MNDVWGVVIRIITRNGSATLYLGVQSRRDDLKVPELSPGRKSWEHFWQYGQSRRDGRIHSTSAVPAGLVFSLNPTQDCVLG